MFMIRAADEFVPVLRLFRAVFTLFLQEEVYEKTG
jgi:hypothetical protein